MSEYNSAKSDVKLSVYSSANTIATRRNEMSHCIAASVIEV